jgi:hypothetical protein
MDRVGVTEGASLSDDIEAWLDDDGLTVGHVVDALDERSFALVLMLVMLPSALPIPTGGVTHVLELVAAVVLLQVIVGRRELWLPRRLLEHRLGEVFTGKVLPRVMRFVRWFERIARQRGARLLRSAPVLSVLGLVMLGFVVGAFVAPPFSGLDTLPSFGVVVVSLGLVFRDGLIVIGGIVAGFVGIALLIALASVVWSFFS